MTKTVRKAKTANGLLGARLLKMSRAAAAISAFMRTFGSEHRLLILSLLVEGELVAGADGAETRVWPSQREVAKRFKVAPSLVAAFAKL
jgi:hypothetical protein